MKNMQTMQSVPRQSTLFTKYYCDKIKKTLVIRAGYQAGIGDKKSIQTSNRRLLGRPRREWGNNTNNVTSYKACVGVNRIKMA